MFISTISGKAGQLNHGFPKLNIKRIEPIKQFFLQNKQLLKVIFGFASLLGLVYFIQFYFFFEEGKQPFPWFKVLVAYMGVFYLYVLFSVLIIYLSKRFRIINWNIGTIALHICFSLILSAAYLLLGVVYQRVVDFYPPGLSIWETFEYALVHNSHISIIVYWAVLGATNAFEYLAWYRAAEGERVVLLDKLEKLENEEYAERYQVKERGMLVNINMRDILWIEAFDNYVKLHAQDRFYLMRKTLGSLEGQLNPSIFCRVHRSFIVNADAVESLKKYKNGDALVTMANGSTVKVSRNYRSALSELFKF